MGLHYIKIHGPPRVFFQKLLGDEFSLTFFLEDTAGRCVVIFVGGPKAFVSTKKSNGIPSLKLTARP